MGRPVGGPGPDQADQPVDVPPKRAYTSPVRREQAARTRESIVAAAVEMVHGFPTGDWRDLTVRAVARGAGVNESTVYRYFSTERRLRDAVMRRLEEEAGVDVDELRLDTFADVINRVFTYLASFPATQPTIDDPTFADIDQRRRESLLAAVARSTAGWTDLDREMAAAVLDVFWSVPTFERMITAWELDAQRAARAVSWVIGLIETAVRDGNRPDA
jgi:AcrR family transcriptional regulator